MLKIQRGYKRKHVPCISVAKTQSNIDHRKNNIGRDIKSGRKSVEKMAEIKVDVLGEFHWLAQRAHRAKSGQKSQGLTSDSHTFPLKIKSNFQAGQMHGLYLSLYDVNDNDENFPRKGEMNMVNLTEGKQAKEGSRGDGGRKR